MTPTRFEFMTLFSEDSGHHTLHAFNDALRDLNDEVIKLTQTLASQFELSMQALESRNEQSIETALKQTEHFNQLISDFDDRLPVILVRFLPVANDLQAIVGLFRIKTQLEIVGGAAFHFMMLSQSLIRLSADSKRLPMVSCSMESAELVLRLLNALKQILSDKNTDIGFSVLENEDYRQMNLYSHFEQHLPSILQTSSGNTFETIYHLIGWIEFCPNEFCQLLIRILETNLMDCVFREQWISEAAFYLAEQRQFASGYELDDWLQAEKEFEEKIQSRFLSLKNIPT